MEADRFWSKVDKSGECWLWTAGQNGMGYGAFHISPTYKVVTAHRYAYQVSNGPIPDGMFVCHVCDVPRCVNPAHLFLGTQRENMHDCAVKGRMTKKLTAEQAAEIRQQYRPRTMSERMLAKRFGVTRNTIRNILFGRSFRLD